MKKNKHIAVGIFALMMLSAPFAFADGMSASIDSIAPGTTIFAKNKITFTIHASGFTAQKYQVSDSFAGSTASIDNIDQVGNFFWVPVNSDVGTHTLTITPSDYYGGSASVTQTITVAPAPYIAIQSVSPSTKIMPATKFSFTVVPTGFTDPTYVISDSLSGSTVNNVTINSSGNFVWTPDISDNGEHTITVYASDALGHYNSTSVHVMVGVGPKIIVASVLPSANASPGQMTSFNATPMNFSPTAFSVLDSFSGSTISNNNINTLGTFSWTPVASDIGTHVLTVTGIVGAYGQSATTSVTINVLGPGGVPVTPSVSPLTALSQAAASGAAVDALKAQLALLNAKIAAQTGASAAPAPETASSPTTNSGPSFTIYLYPGLDGVQVTHLQNVLSQQGFFTGEANGHYGPLTTIAVKKFQNAHGLDPMGVVGPATRVALNALSSGTVAGASTVASGSYNFENFLELGAHGTDVMELQKRLISLGLLSGEATGYFGTMTETAVKQFQSTHGIDPKGWVGPSTRAVLNQ